ncbi:sodium-dependent transporter [Motilimonas eburnea]|uniref:sodium-dependent transporter n=1 Tax=Motilimonas eburnea TaxID=1737488 RepID=UPI001E401FC4|nr:sodium-dependent transporter [Motilimonas eburnea]MCE2571935.1 sodium-dependent transporter [Motilimonas eburnea]
MSTNTSVTGRWSSRFAYILAATGAAVGLGNIWKFPYIMGENGGGAFVIVYLLCILFIGIPVMMAETFIGKRGRSTPANAAAKVSQESGHSTHWSLLGTSGVLAGFLILSFYVVIAGWALAYVFYAGTGEFSTMAAAAVEGTTGHADAVGALFGGLLSDPFKLILCTTVMVVATVLVLGKGLNKGLEAAVTSLMPALFILLAIIMVYSAIEGHFGEAAAFMFAPDFSKLTVHSVLEALGHAFFTLSLSSGIMMIYGAYLPEGVSIARTSIWIAICDTVVALMAGLAIYPIVFANGMEPSAGPGLLFQTLPIAFGKMPMGDLFGTVFFVMIVFAAFTSAIALLESATAYLVERKGLNRWPAAIVSGVGIWLLSLGSIYSFTGAEWTKMSFFGHGENFFDVLDYITSKLMLPLAGLFTAIFVGWRVKRHIVEQEIQLNGGAFTAFFFCLKYVAPVAITIVFAQLVGIINL